MSLRTWMAAAIALLAPLAVICRAQPPDIRVLERDYPRAFFFRAAEGRAANPGVSYRRWDEAFSRLMGIEGKVLDEEVPGRSRRNVDFFSRFKKKHPRQIVLLHYNGNARDPRYQTEKYFAGHWVYYNGAKVLSDIPLADGETTIRVDDTGLFRTGIGRYRSSNEDVGLCMLDPEGKPDWWRSEQVRLVSVNAKAGTIRVRRGCYGTQPRAFPAGRSYAAAHAHEGPWGRRSNLMWFYNYSTRCPKDSRGRNCSDVHADELATRLLPGGELELFDGVEFDVLANGHRGRRGRGMDCDADGRIDNGVFDGRNTYGAGVVKFCKKLRRLLGDSKLLLADGGTLRNQRAFGVLNGIESEGWPTLRDWAIDDWSGGLNRHFFWRDNAARPAFSYINHKYVMPAREPGRNRRPDVPWRVHRLVFAAACFTDSAVCYSFAPPRKKGEMYGIWDELRMGADEQIGWLGKPIGPPLRLALRRPDLLEGTGRPPTQALLERFSGEGVRCELQGDVVKVVSSKAGQNALVCRIEDVPCDGPDLCVSVAARCEPREGQPTEMARMMWLGIATPEGQLIGRTPPETGMCLRGGTEQDIDGATGAVCIARRPARLGGEEHDALFVHPPFKQCKGYTFWQCRRDIPADGRLDFYLGMGEKSPIRSDGVVFKVLIAPVAGGETGEYSQVFEHRQKASRWSHHAVSLKRWAGRRAELKFVSDCGPEDDTTTDHSYWGDVWIIGPDGRDSITMDVRRMTWVNDTQFKSYFYFSDIRSDTVDLELEIEGSEPLWLSAVTAHGGPDVIARKFERGVVLANPSPRLFAFDLQDISAGGSYRRLRGSSKQDRQTNDGSTVRSPIRLGPKDALFLVETTR